MQTLRRMAYWLCAIGSLWVSPAVALFMGIALALTIGAPYAKANKKVSKYLLQASVVGLGFGMNLHASLAAGKEGMLFTIVSVVGVMLVGVGLGKLLKVNPKNAYLMRMNRLPKRCKMPSKDRMNRKVIVRICCHTSM